MTFQEDEEWRNRRNRKLLQDCHLKLSFIENRIYSALDGPSTDVELSEAITDVAARLKSVTADLEGVQQ